MAAMIGVAAPESRADSAIALLGKFDAEQIERVYPATDDESRGELAKLVFRLRSVDSASLSAKVASQAARLGDAVRIEGEITSIAAITVPDRLVEFLDISRLHVIDVLTANESGTEQRSRIITADLPREAKPGDRIAAGGVLIELAGESSPIVFAAPRVEWFPRTLQGDGWSLLGQASVDVSGLADLATRSRMPLSARDGEMFYAMLAAAREIGQRGDLPPPRLVTAVMLLGGTETKSTAGQLQPKEAVIRGGDWIAMSLQTVQVTRVVVTEPWRQQQLGSDHYFQIDAVADLGNVDVQIERPNGEQGPPARFENRYPVSVVTAELPSFLSESIHSEEGGAATVAEISVAIAVDAFFFRLWSYSTDYMDQFGGGKQIGPLLIAARIDQRGKIADPAGVGLIGWLAAAAILTAIVAIAVWNLVLAKRDRRVKEKRMRNQAEQVQLPDEAAM